MGSERLRFSRIRVLGAAGANHHEHKGIAEARVHLMLDLRKCVIWSYLKSRIISC